MITPFAKYSTEMFDSKLFDTCDMNRTIPPDTQIHVAGNFLIKLLVFIPDIYIFSRGIVFNFWQRQTQKHQYLAKPAAKIDRYTYTN